MSTGWQQPSGPTTLEDQVGKRHSAQWAICPTVKEATLRIKPLITSWSYQQCFTTVEIFSGYSFAAAIWSHDYDP